MSNIVNEAVEFEINGVNFKYDFTSIGAERDKTISQILADILDKANVQASYSEITKSFTLRSKEEGATQNIKCEDKSGNFVSSILGSSTTAKGKDAKIELKTPNNSTATTIIKPSNNFTIDGVNYNIAGAKKTKR
ncbi:hypothetical protein JTT01_07215 [Clostridium botulinum]|nr:hypothetical protein [Clostridium botulinum]MCS4466330.1 hypothetical protein [Clostridium botulinum]